MIGANTTIGFESEWVDGVEGLLAGLHGRGHLPNAELHRYHCDCSHCGALTRRGLRAQRDSTVGGELISGIFQVQEQQAEIAALTNDIESVAFDADATPGINAGFHVHAQNPYVHMTRQWSPYSVRLFASNLLMLPVLTESFAPGRHGQMGGMNEDTLSYACQIWENYHDQTVTPARLAHRLAEHADNDPSEVAERMRYVFNDCIGADRHAHIAFITRYNTVEYRLWRSTRMAWRMHLYIWLSALMVSPDFHALVLAAHGPRTTTTTLANPGWLYELLDRRDVPSDLVPMLREQEAYVVWSLDNDTPNAYTLA